MGWYVLGEDQQQVGPYAFSELRGEFFNIMCIFFFEWFCVSNEQSGVELGLGIVYFFFCSLQLRKLTQHCVDFEHTCDFMLKLKPLL